MPVEKLIINENKLRYHNGTWFAVPLRKGGIAVGIAARMDGKGCVLGYFFGPKCNLIPSLDTVCKLKANNAILVTQFGDLGLIEDEWPIIGECENWKEEDWPLPPFLRVDKVAGKAWITIYSDDLQVINEEPCIIELAAKYPEDGLDGAGAVEIRLTMLLSPESLENEK